MEYNIVLFHVDTGYVDHGVTGIDTLMEAKELAQEKSLFDDSHSYIVEDDKGKVKTAYFQGKLDYTMLKGLGVVTNKRSNPSKRKSVKSRNPVKRDANAFYYLTDSSGNKGRSYVKLVTARNAAKKWANDIGKPVTVVKYWGTDSEVPFEYVYPSKRKNPVKTIKKTASKSIRGLKDHVSDIGGKIVAFGKDTITILAPKGTTAKLMSNPGTRAKIKNVQMGYYDYSGAGNRRQFHPIRASVDYDEGRLSMPVVLNEKKETDLHRRVRDVEYAKIKALNAKTPATKTKWLAKWKFLKSQTEGMFRRGGKKIPSWAKTMMS